MHKIRFYTRALKFEREFNWPLIGPVTFQQLMVSAVSFVLSTILFLFFMPAEVAPVSGGIFGSVVWFLYGAIKPDGKRIHRFCIDGVKFILRPKKKNMGQVVTSTKIKVRKWVRVQE